MRIDTELLKEGYIIEVRYLDYDKSKDPVFCVKIKRYIPESRQIEQIAAGYSRENVEQAYDYAITKFREQGQIDHNQPYK